MFRSYSILFQYQLSPELISLARLNQRRWTADSLQVRGQLYPSELPPQRTGDDVEPVQTLAPLPKSRALHGAGPGMRHHRRWGTGIET